jgi:hypothetical protein
MDARTDVSFYTDASLIVDSVLLKPLDSARAFRYLLQRIVVHVMPRKKLMLLSTLVPPLM